MTDAPVDRYLSNRTATTSPVTMALALSATLMVLTGVASALVAVPSLVTGTYYASTFAVVALLWIHGLRTARCM